MQISSWSDFKDKDVALLGAGIENLALVPYLQEAGAHVTVCDRLAVPDRISDKWGEEIEIIVGEHYLEGLDSYDIVFRIAGLPVATLEKALSKSPNRPIVTSAIDLFLALCTCRVIGVTGTKGKGTTSTLIGSILEAAGKNVVVVGNIGKPIFDSVKDLGKESYAVIELSSFQLEDVKHSPAMAVVLPISQDHLQPLSAQNPNYHQTMNDYVAAKAHITLYQSKNDTLVYAADNDFSTSIASVAKAKKISVSQTSKDADYYVDPAGIVFHEGKQLVELGKLGLRGQHVYLNATFAIAVTQQYNCREIDIAQGIANYKPLPHRLEEFATVNEIMFVDDSYATAPDAALAAIETYDRPIIWIGGGSSKGAWFNKLAEGIATSSVKQAILIGQEASRIKEVLNKEAANVPAITVDSLEEAVNQAFKHAKPGYVVLLSPACASKDMFSNAAERGDLFKKLVNEHKI